MLDCLGVKRYVRLNIQVYDIDRNRLRILIRYLLDKTHMTLVVIEANTFHNLTGVIREINLRQRVVSLLVKAEIERSQLI